MVSQALNLTNQSLNKHTTTLLGNLNRGMHQLLLTCYTRAHSTPPHPHNNHPLVHPTTSRTHSHAIYCGNACAQARLEAPVAWSSSRSAPRRHTGAPVLAR